MAASAAVALALGPSPGLEPAENWDDDFEFGGEGRGESVGTGGGGSSGRRRNSRSAGVGRGSGGYASSGMGPGTESVGHTAGVSGPSDISASEEDHLSSSTPSAHCQGHTHPEPLHIRAAAFSPSSPVSGSSAYVTPTNLSPLGSATSRASIYPRSSAPATKKPTLAPGPSNGRPLQQSASLGRTSAAGVFSSSAAVGEGDSDAHEAGGAGEGALMKEKEKCARRNSLGDLQIPTRISQAQVGLRRDLDMVKEFAGYVGEIKEFQQTYHALASEIQAMLDAQAHDLQHQHQRQHQSPLVSNPPPPPAKDSIHTTSGFFSAFRDIRKPKTRGRSNTNGRLSLPPQHEQPKEMEMEEQPSKSKEHLLAYKELASAFWSIISKYRITWECAELLVELGGGGPDESRSSLNTSASAPVAVATPVDFMGRERASTDTLSAGDQSKPLPALPHPSSSSSSSPPTPAHSRQHLHTQPPHAPPPPALVSAPTGWHDHDLSQRQRQVVLLREMLSNGSTSTSVAAEETQTLTTTAMEVDREWRWGGDGLGNSTVTLPLPEEEEERTAKGREKGPGSSRLELGMRGIRDMLRALKFKSSRAHAEDAAPSSYYTAPQPKPQPSPRRPSLASIFHLGTKTKNRASASTVTLVEDPPVPVSSVPSSASPSSSIPPCCDHPTGAEDSSSNSTGEEEDWDHMDSAFDFDSSDAFATVRGRRRTGTGTGWEGGHRSPDQQPNAFNHINTSTPTRTHTNANAAATKTGTVRSMPPYLIASDSTSLQPDPIQKLAMTPENIRPLLENAREVRAKIVECLAELRGLVPPDGHDGS